MENKHPPEVASDKPLLTADMIRQDMKKRERRVLIAGLTFPFLLIAATAVPLIRTLTRDTVDADASSWIGPALLLTAGFCLGVAIIVRAVRTYRRVAGSELVMESDIVSYVESDRAGTVRHGGHVRGPVYEDFLHFKSGREFKVERYKYREADEEAFLVVAYAAEPEHILSIYRLSEYNWQA